MVTPNRPLGIGLRLSNQASLELQQRGTGEFKDWMKTNGFYVFTMNGFPYGGFHRQKVKDLVHQPDWTYDERVDYTIRLFNLLAELLPSGTDGGISTLLCHTSCGGNKIKPQMCFEGPLTTC